MSTVATRARQTPLRDIFAYATGDGASSLVMNSIFGFSMLYYTEALGLDYKLAGIAMAVATLWDAITDPIMGHITDNTRSRFGRRHPYVLFGGIMTVVCYYAIWAVPSYFRTTDVLLLDWLPAWLSAIVPSFVRTAPLLFWYLVGVNLLLRTGVTVFLVPFVALGFEVCTDYNQRTTLQGVRGGLNMAVNLLGPAMAWRLFFSERDDGMEPTKLARNFENMGLVFAIAALAFVLFVVFATRKYAVDTRQHREIAGNRLGQILCNLKGVLFDPFPRAVFLFISVFFMGIVLLTSLQMYVYVHFMKFSPWERTVVHGSTMVAAGLGALLASTMVHRFDKKPAIYITVGAAALANIMLVVLFATGWVSPGLTWQAIPIATLVFLVFHATYHLGCTLATTVANSMMADVSEISRCRTGILKDGSYSAMLSFVLKASVSLGLLLCGYGLEWAGFDVKSDQQTPEAIRNLLLIAFLGGTTISLAALVTIMRYPVNRAYMAEIQAALPDDREPNQLAGTGTAAEPGLGPPPEAP